MPPVASSQSLSGYHPPHDELRSERRLGEVAVDLGLAAADDVEAAAADAAARGVPIGVSLVDRGVLDQDQLARVIAERLGMAYVDLAVFPVDHAAAALLPPEVARRYEALPVAHLGEHTLLVATANPSNVLAVDDIRMLTRCEVHAAVAAREDLLALIARLGRLEEVAEVEDEAERTAAAVDAADVLGDDDAPVVKLVHSLISEAVELGASDVHFEPDGAAMRVQYRIDGVLVPSTAVPARMARQVISRLKIMASLDIAERRLPQDGRLALSIGDRTVDVRVVTLPLVRGESVVLRILDRSVALDLDGLGLAGGPLERLKGALARPYGAVLVTGPTGSGKTTTLYGALGVVNCGGRSIVTIEDPVEYRMDGVKQLQVNAKIDMTFARGLRAIVRADPDVIMVGEIRDHETARIAIESALTGHLVLSTLHTRDAPTAIARLVDMGIEPFLVASAIDCVVAQRLARTLCSSCRRPVTLPAGLLCGHGLAVGADLPAFEPAGCSRCGGTGYRGRIGLFEVMPVTEELRSLIVRGDPAHELAAAAVDQGMSRLRDDGLEKLRSGATSLAEILRVAGA